MRACAQLPLSPRKIQPTLQPLTPDAPLWKRLLKRLSPMLSLLALVSMAFPVQAVEVPPELAPWVPWVLESHPDFRCPTLNGSANCIWPGELFLDARAGSGSFTLTVTTDRKVAVPLPGGLGAWPQQVQADGRPAVVIPKAGVPYVTLEKGAHRVSGTYLWSSLPQRLPMPVTIGLIHLSVDGKAVAWPEVDEGGLRLGEGESRGPGENRLELDVSRKIQDGVPVLLTTRVSLRASGSAREVRLGQVLVPNTRPVALQANLPARFSPEGELVVQVRPGTFEVTFEALHNGEVASLTAPKLAEPWPTQEYWAVALDEQARAVTLSGPSGVDPARTPLPTDWRNLPTFLMNPGQALEFKTLRRGVEEAPPNRLTLQRELWLDLDGGGFTVRDRFSGTMNRDWRLDLLPPGRLGHVVDQGVDQVITKGKQGAGVEVRTTQVQLLAESRLEPFQRHIKAVGWQSEVSSLSSKLYLPPGWQLLYVGGVDSRAGTLIDRWTLFDLFFVTILSLAAGKLLGWRWGLVTLVAMVLCRHESDAPEWSWVTLLVLSALIQALHEGKLQKVLRWARGLTLAALFLMLMPYAIDQVREGLSPALERPWVSAYHGPVNMADLLAGSGGGEGDKNAEAPAAMEEAMPAPAPEAPPPEEQNVRQEYSRKMDVSGLLGTRGDYDSSANWKGKAMKAQTLQQDPAAVVQTGPGVPQWSWDTYELSWSGSVPAEHELTLWLIGPRLKLLWNLVRLSLLALLALKLANVKELSRHLKSNAPVAAGIFLCLLPGLGQAQDAAEQTAPAPTAESKFAQALQGAQAPTASAADQWLLQELETRLLQAPVCAPECISAPSLRLEVTGDRLSLVAEVHAQERWSWPLPGPAKVWTPASVTLDGAGAGMVRAEDGFVYLRLEPGVHVVRAEGPLPPADSVTLQLGLQPQLVSFRGEGWTLDGIHADGTAEPSLQLTRVMGGTAGTAARSSENLDPWVMVQRTLDLGIPWRVSTVVSRPGPSGSPLSLRIPLLPGEAVTDAGLEVRDGAVQISLGQDQAQVEWSSTLKEASSLTLKAPKGVAWSEQWTVLCSPIFSCSAKGLAPVRHVEDGRWSPRWLPWPGEEVVLTASRPEAAQGQTVTIERVDLEYTPGLRSAEGVLTLAISSSQGGQHPVTLPPEAKLQQVSINGQARPIQLQSGKVPLPLQPGRQVLEVRWQQPHEWGFLDRVPPIRVGATAVNVTTNVKVPAERWILFLAGPMWGPLPLFWSYVILVLLFAPLLSRLPWAPLKTWQWMLLGLGMLAADPSVPLVVGLWFMALGWREQAPRARWWTFNFYQLVLVGLTLAAMGCFYEAVTQGLLGDAPAHIEGNSSQREKLVWYADRALDFLPEPLVVSIPLWAWRLVMLAWSLWLAASLVKWLPWAWRTFASSGLWRPMPPSRPPAGLKNGLLVPPSSPAAPTGPVSPSTQTAEPAARAATGEGESSSPAASAMEKAPATPPSGQTLPGLKPAQEGPAREVPPVDPAGPADTAPPDPKEG